MKKLKLSYFLVCFSLVFPSLLIASTYTITDLGTLGGNYSYARGMNDLGKVVGDSRPVINGEVTGNHAFVWDDANGMVDIGTLENQNNSSFAFDINNFGNIVGQSTVVDITTGIASHAFLWDESNGMTDLGTLGGSHSEAYSVNDSGQIVGKAYTVNDSYDHAFIWDEVNGMQDLGTLGGWLSSAQDINESGQVVGYSVVNNSYHAFLWESSTGMVDLGMLVENFSYASAINNAQQIVGSVGTNAILWDSINGLIDLGTLGGEKSVAFDINDKAQVVGQSYVQPGSTEKNAFIWENGIMINLNDYVDDEWILRQAVGINNAGQITGYGTINGQSHAFLLTPNTSTIPEPSTIFLFSLGILFFAAHKRNLKFN